MDILNAPLNKLQTQSQETYCDSITTSNRLLFSHYDRCLLCGSHAIHKHAM